jgi:ATP/maltotriose-dependent transcriptional regulator MalT
LPGGSEDRPKGLIGGVKWKNDKVHPSRDKGHSPQTNDRETLGVVMASLLQTKLLPPPPRPDTVIRDRLQMQLDRVLQPGLRAALVSASAGFGKSTLVAGWSRRVGLPLAWLTLEARDDSPRAFCSYLLSAVRGIDPVLGRESNHLLEGGEMDCLLRLMAQDLTNRQIAARLVLSPNTLKAHANRIFGKLDAHSRMQAFVKAHQLGLIEN